MRLFILILAVFLAAPASAMDKKELLALSEKIGKDVLIGQLKGQISSSIYALSPSSNKDEVFKFATGVEDTQTPEERAMRLNSIQVTCTELFNLTTPLTEKEFYKKCTDHGWLYNSDAPGI